MRASTASRRTQVRGALGLFVLGTIGVAALSIYSLSTLRELPELSTFGTPTLLLLAAANSLLLLVLAVLLGALTAPRIDLTSHVYTYAAGERPAWRSFCRSVPTAILTGVVLFVVVMVLDLLISPVTGIGTDSAINTEAALADLLASIPMRLLYGGITEEILLRWSVMAPIAFGLWWGTRRLSVHCNDEPDGSAPVGERIQTPPASIMWIAIVVSAVLFGVGHLPALAATFDLTIALVVRTVTLNAIVGIALGWIFWRYSLETAMVAHASFHVALVSVSGVVLGIG